MLAELAAAIQSFFGARLAGLYLFGSLVSGDFYPGRSDLDLIAVVESHVSDDEIAALRELHEEYEAARPGWRDRIEVLYLSRAVLRTFADEPRGRVARISPGEPLHFRELDGDLGWLLDWHGAVSGEIVVGGAPLSLGPAVTPDRLRAAVISQLREMGDIARGHDVAYVPSWQGYIVATVCRALYFLETGDQTSKERAVAWYAERHPDQAEYVWGRYRAYRDDVRAAHERLITFVNRAMAASFSVADANEIAADPIGDKQARG